MVALLQKVEAAWTPPEGPADAAAAAALAERKAAAQPPDVAAVRPAKRRRVDAPLTDTEGAGGS